MRTRMSALLQSPGPILTDGAMGTMLFELGLEHGSAPEQWNLERPEAVRGVHRGYIEQGAQIILTNTFGGSRLRLDLHKLSNQVGELNRTAAELAGAEAEAAGHPVAVAGSMGPSGGILEPVGELTFGEARGAFAEQAAALSEGGVDVFWVETMSDLEEVRAAVEGCRQADPDMPVVATMTFDTHGHTMMGVSPEVAFKGLKGLDLIALGANCGNGTKEIEMVIGKMAQLNEVEVLVAKANAGIPHIENGVPVYDATPSIMAEYAVKVRDLGAGIIGACCGSTPDHIAAMAEALGRGVPSP